MPRFFIDENALCGDIITVRGGDAVHIGRSLRMKIGDSITFCREGTDFVSVIEKMTADEVFCRVMERIPSSSEPNLRLTIYQALPKQDKPELIIQKCTELGAARIVFFISKRCVSRPDERSAEKKLARWRKVAEEAAKQAESAVPSGSLSIGNGLKWESAGKLAVDTADKVERDNTKPVTSAAVHTEIGNNEALLAAI